MASNVAHAFFPTREAAVRARDAIGRLGLTAVVLPVTRPLRPGGLVWPLDIALPPTNVPYPEPVLLNQAIQVVWDNDGQLFEE